MGMQTDGTFVCPGGVVGNGEYLEVGVGVCCSEERCLPVAEPGCAALGEEWEYHPEFTSCDPNPCLRMLRGECVFPYRLELPEGAALRYITWDFETTYRAGDDVVVDWQDGKLTINGHPYLPHPERPRSPYSVEQLQETYGAVPFVQQLLHQQSTPDWYAAERAYWAVAKRLMETTADKYHRLIRQGSPAPEAASACVEQLSRSPLVDSAAVNFSDPSTGKSDIKIVFRGGAPGGGIALSPQPPWPTDSPGFITHRDACDYLRLLTSLAGVPGRAATVRYGHLRSGLED